MPYERVKSHRRRTSKGKTAQVREHGRIDRRTRKPNATPVIVPRSRGHEVGEDHPSVDPRLAKERLPYVVKLVYLEMLGLGQLKEAKTFFDRFLNYRKTYMDVYDKILGVLREAGKGGFRAGGAAELNKYCNSVAGGLRKVLPGMFSDFKLNSFFRQEKPANIFKQADYLTIRVLKKLGKAFLYQREGEPKVKEYNGQLYARED